MFRDVSAALEALADAMLKRLRAYRPESEPTNTDSAQVKKATNGTRENIWIVLAFRRPRHRALTRRWAAFLAPLLVVAAGVPAAWADGGSFSDDDGSTHEANIELVAEAGITLGCGDGLFCPDEAVTRGQMASFVVRALGYVDDGGGDLFIDDDGSTHEANIDLLAAAGVTLGCGDGGFCPFDAVTRGQMASFIARAFHYDVASAASDHFSDDGGSTHEANINLLFEAGVTQGCATGSFCPNDVVTRGQMASFLARALKLPWPTDHSDHPDLVPETNDRMGNALALGDFNGDGWDDIAVGIWGENDFEGAVRIVFGTAGGPTGTTQFFTDTDFGFTPQASAFVGKSLAVGDFDDDGYDDLAIGANDPAAGDVGRVLVARGGSGGLTPDGELHRSFADSGVPRQMVAGRFGRGPADDLAIAYPFATVNGESFAGLVEVVYPGEYLTIISQYHQDSPGVGGAVEERDYFGISLAVGDLTGDEFDELVIGVPFEDLNVGDDEIDVGVVHVFYGSDTGLLVDRGTSPELIHQADIGAANEKGDDFGASITIGDLTGDGIGDLIVGAPGEDLESPIVVEDRGNVHVIPGSANGPAGSAAFDLDSVATEQPLDETRALGSWMAFVAGGTPMVAVLSPGPFLGVFLLYSDGLEMLEAPTLKPDFDDDWRAASGDIDGDGQADLVIGSSTLPLPDGSTKSRAGGIAIWLQYPNGALAEWQGGLIQ